jgi:hypothetical protein
MFQLLPALQRDGTLCRWPGSGQKGGRYYYLARRCQLNRGGANRYRQPCKNGVRHVLSLPAGATLRPTSGHMQKRHTVTSKREVAAVQ